MKIAYRILDTAKAGNQRSEIEDASCPAVAVTVEAPMFTCAIADGATQGSHSGPWARALCESLAHDGGPAVIAAALAPIVDAARERFQAWESQYLVGREAAGRQLQWFEEAVIRSGAYSTLLGVHLEEHAAGARFHATAIGDSCLLVVRGGAVALSFPLTASDQFAGAPLLIASTAEHNSGMASGVRQLSGELTAGDALLLCTDALAAWALREVERGSDPAARLIALVDGDTREAFDDFLAGLRRERQIRNDDVTLACIRLEG